MLGLAGEGCDCRADGDGADGAGWLELVALKLGLRLVGLLRLAEMLGLVGLGLQLHPAPAPAPNKPGG